MIFVFFIRFFFIFHWKIIVRFHKIIIGTINTI
jgi:hypothetical protein